MSVYTPRYHGQRVRIPENKCMFNASHTLVVVETGDYPMVENGQPVTSDTPMVRLDGKFRVRRAACGLGCRCDATITEAI